MGAYGDLWGPVGTYGGSWGPMGIDSGRGRIKTVRSCSPGFGEPVGMHLPRLWLRER